MPYSIAQAAANPPRLIFQSVHEMEMIFGLSGPGAPTAKLAQQRAKPELNTNLYIYETPPKSSMPPSGAEQVAD